MHFLQCIVVVALGLSLPWASTAWSGQNWPGELVYRESSPSAEHLKHYAVVNGPQGPVLTLRENDIVQEIVSLESGVTRHETYRNTKTGDFVEIVREAGGLAYSGTLKGQPQHKTESVDDSPWYGSVLLLRHFVLSSNQEQTFHLTRAEETSLVTLEASKQGRETIQMNGIPVEAIKVKMTLPGMKAWMWKSLYWFRAEDGILLRSQGTRGPASPVFTVELVREAPMGGPALSQGVPTEAPAP